jgi:hypothetical protein
MRLSSRLYYWWSAQGKSQDLICQAPTVPLYHAYTYEPDPLLIGGFFYNPQTKSLDTDLIQRLQTVCLGYVRSRVRLSNKEKTVLLGSTGRKRLRWRGSGQSVPLMHCNPPSSSVASAQRARAPSREGQRRITVEAMVTGRPDGNGWTCETAELQGRARKPVCSILLESLGSLVEGGGSAFPGG